MDPDTIVTRNDELLSALVDGEIVFVSLATDSYVALDAVGRRIWELLERSRRLQELVDLLCNEFDGPRDVIAADVATFVQELVGEGIVSVQDRNAG
jgi:hypothetical protein